MSSFIKADIFFFVTAIAVVALALLFAVALVYLIRILRDVKDISERVKEEASSITYDVSRFRAKIKEEGLQWRHIAEFLGLTKRQKTKGRK